MIRHGARCTLLLTLMLGAFGYGGSAFADSVFSGSMNVQAGGLDHPLGVAAEPSTPFAGADFALGWSLGSFASRWRLTYEGSVNRFDPDVGLDFSRHALGVEWLRGAPRDEINWSAGAQYAARLNESFYTPYDYREGFAYLAAKTYFAGRVLASGFAGMRLRGYAELPEESYLEPHAVLVCRSFFDSGTSLGTTLRAGGKWFHEPEARSVWNSSGAPSTSQVSVSLDISQSLSPRVGIRASVQQRMQTSAFPYLVEADLYDSPLLDRYASAGPSVESSLKVLAPGQVWLQTGFAWWEDDYGETSFANGGAGSTRLDRTSSVWLSLERRFLRGGRGLTLHASLYRNDQRSNLDSYDWSGWTSIAGVRWNW